jgi:hypothetical protein
MSTAPRGSILFRYVPGVGRIAIPCCPCPSPTTTLPSGYSSLNGLTALTNTFAVVGTSTITITTASHVMAFVSSEINNTNTSNEHTVSMYLTTNGDTSTTTDNSIIRAKNSSTPSQAALSIVHRSSIMQPGTYTITVFAKADANSVMNITHLDIGSIGNLV